MSHLDISKARPILPAESRSVTAAKQENHSKFAPQKSHDERHTAQGASISTNSQLSLAVVPHTVHVDPVRPRPVSMREWNAARGLLALGLDRLRPRSPTVKQESGESQLQSDTVPAPPAAGGARNAGREDQKPLIRNGSPQVGENGLLEPQPRQPLGGVIGIKQENGERRLRNGGILNARAASGAEHAADEESKPFIRHSPAPVGEDGSPEPHPMQPLRPLTSVVNFVERVAAAVTAIWYGRPDTRYIFVSSESANNDTESRGAAC